MIFKITYTNIVKNSIYYLLELIQHNDKIKNFLDYEH